MDLSADLRERTMAFMKSVARRSGDPFYTVSPADGFRFVFVNEAACFHFGRSREELLTLSLSDVDPLLPPQQWLAFWQDLKEKGAIFFETVHRHADGRDIPVAVSANLFAEGGRELFGGCIHDLREQRQSEEALRESEEMLRVIFNSTCDGILIHAPDGRIMEANERFLRMYRLNREEALRLSIADISSQAMSMEEGKAIWAKVLAGEPQLFDWRARRGDGSEFEVEVFLRRVQVGGGPAILATLRDISERKEVQSALIAAKDQAEAGSRAKDRFLLNMSHELRTPLTVIAGMLDLSLLEAPSPSLRRYLEAGRQASEVLLTLIGDLLDMSRLERGERLVEERPFDLPRCIREVAEPYHEQARKKGIGLHFFLADDLPRQVAGDCDRLKQVLNNLVENALRFTDQGEVGIEVTAGKEQEARREVRFDVRDTGIGVPADALGRIFRRFTQVDDSLNRRYGGSGLGLAISRGLVERMGGKIAVESREGEGSVFSFVLPLKIVAGGEEERGEVTPPEAVRPARILLVEDEPQIRELLCLVLEKRGWRMETAASGQEAIERWQEDGFDLVLMDVQMPGMSGLEATRRIRDAEKESGRHTCIIALTAHAGRESREDCLAAGMSGFVSKPVKIVDLYAAIDGCLGEGCLGS